MDFRALWQRLQGLGLNAYEARSYLVLLGHPRFKALELAARAHVPRQKIYEVLDSLLEKGFASVIQDRTKLFSAIPPDEAVPTYLARRAKDLEHQLADQARAGQAMVEDLMAAYTAGQEGPGGALDVLRIIYDPAQTAARFRRMLSEAGKEYLEFSRPPYAVDPLEAEQVLQAAARGVQCRVLVEQGTLDEEHARFLNSYQSAGVEVRKAPRVPMKLALLDGRKGLLALVDPVTTKPAWTAIVFEHEGMGEAMRSVFEDYWRRAV
jgi:sugar-specific transcriptional regulator TrmB